MSVVMSVQTCDNSVSSSPLRCRNSVYPLSVWPCQNIRYRQSISVQAYSICHAAPRARARSVFIAITHVVLLR